MILWYGSNLYITGLLWEEITGHRSFDVVFGVSLKKLLNKESYYRWVETLWRHFDDGLFLNYISN